MDGDGTVIELRFDGNQTGIGLDRLPNQTTIGWRSSCKWRVIGLQMDGDQTRIGLESGCKWAASRR